MNFRKRALISLWLIGGCFSTGWGVSLFWTENSYSDFSDGYFYRTTSTLANPEVKISTITDWYDTNWNTRKPIKITNSGGALTQYQIQLSLNTSSYIWINKMRSDGADIRVTDEDGKTLIPFWIGISTNQLAASQNTPVWVKVPIIPASSVKRIFVYFNNASTDTILSNRDAVFDLYEDWEDTTTISSNWTLSSQYPAESGLFHPSTSPVVYEGNYGVQAGTIPPNPYAPAPSTSLSRIINLDMAGIVTFYWVYSFAPRSGQNGRKLSFLIDSNEAIYRDGTEPSEYSANYTSLTITGAVWKPNNATIASGSHTLAWKYSNYADGYAYNIDPEKTYLDSAWIDKIVVVKYSPTPPAITPETDEQNTLYYVYAEYYSSVFDMGGENSLVEKTTWTVDNPNLTMKVRYSNDWFSVVSATPTWNSVTNGGIINQRGRYVQYQAILQGDGSTTPQLTGISLQYQPVPQRPSNFTIMTISSTTIKYEWQDNASNETGYLVYSGTRSIPTNGYIASGDNSGYLFALSSDTTYYVEENLLPNTLYSRFVVAYNENGGNISLRSDGKLLAAGTTTFAVVSPVNSEFFVWDNKPLSDNYHYEPIVIGTVTTSATFYFTSNVTTGPAKVQYYRYLWSNSATHYWLGTESLWYSASSYHYNEFTGSTVYAKPELMLTASGNNTWYFHIRSYNAGNISAPESITTLGPYYFIGCPAVITDLVAASNTQQEGAVNLTWTAPTADATTGNIIGGKYIIKWYGFTTIYTDDNVFNSASGVAITTTTLAGRKESVTITGLSPGTKYYFAIKTVDELNNYSQVNIFTSDVSTTAAKVAKIVFKNSPPTTYVGIPTSQLIIECQDAAGNPLKLYQATDVYLQSTSSDGRFSLYPDFSAEATYVNIPAGSDQAIFYYKDIQSGNPTITVDESPSQGWTAGQQAVTVLPGKAVKFEIDTPANGVIGTPVNVTVRANDGYNSSNTSTDYEGAISATATIAGSVISPATHYFTVSTDAGQKILSWNSPSYAGAGTLSVEENIPQSFTDVFFVNNSQGYIAGSEGMIKKTGDGGLKWFAPRYSSGTANALNSIAVDSSGNNVVASGLSGKVLVSTDGLNTFNIIDTGAGQDLNGSFYLNSSTVYVCGNAGVVFKSTDCGFNWQALTGAGVANLYSVYFVNESTGLVCGASGIYKTFDGGSSWSNVLGANLDKITFVDEFTGFSCGNSGKVYKTVDGGDNWSDISPTGITDNLHSIKFVNSNIGYTAGERRTILKTTNGGTNWSAVISTAAVNLRGVSFAGSDILTTIAVGENGTILRTADGGNNWTEVKMTGQSQTVNWNGLVVVSTGNATDNKFKQGRTNQSAIKIMTKTMFGGSSTIDKFRIKLTGGTGTDTDVSAVKFYRDTDNNGIFSPTNDTYLGSNVFSGGSSEISFSGQTISNATFFVVLDISPTATIGNTLGFSLETNCLNVSAGIPLAKNNLPATIPPVDIVPSSCTVYINVSDLVGSTTVQVKQGTKDFPLMYLALKPDRGGSQASLWQNVNIIRFGQSIRDQDITRINIYQDNVIAGNLVASGTFVNGNANLSIHNPAPHYLSDAATQQYYITADISPDAIYSSDVSSVTFGIRIAASTVPVTGYGYFRLDNEGANGFMPSGATYQTTPAKIVVAYDTVFFNPAYKSFTDIKQSEYLYIPVQVGLDENTAVWTKLRVKRLGDATDIDAPTAYLFKENSGDDNLQPSVDTIIGQGNFSGGVADIIFNNPENLNKVLPEFTNYYVAVYVDKRAAEGKTVGLRLDSTSYVTLGGVDIVSGNNFPIQVSAVPIADFPDEVETNLTDLAPAEARVDEEVTMAKVRLWAYCIARLNNLTLQFQGSAQPSDVSLVKIYVDSDNDGYFTTSDVLIASGTFNQSGIASVGVSPSYAVYDTSATLFIRYQLNPAATPGKTVGLGIDIGNGFTYNNPADRPKQTGFFSSSYLNLLDRRTPDVPAVTLNISNPDGKDIGGGIKQYYSSNPGQLSFSWRSAALNGITQGQYGLATFVYNPTNNTPDILSYQVTVDSFVVLSNLNLKHNQQYYIWVKAVSSDGFERVISVPLKIDLTPPPQPAEPTTTAQTSSALQKVPGDSYWINWESVVDEESGIRYYQLEERTNTSMRWQVISATIPATETSYLISGRQNGKLYYYRLRAQNYAGSWSSYSPSSAMAYLTLPDDLISDLGSYPNPFDSRTAQATIIYILNSNAYVQARIYDLLGNLVKEWHFESGSEGGKVGQNLWPWDGTNSQGEKVAMGMYILALEAKSADKNYKKIWKIGVRH